MFAYIVDAFNLKYLLLTLVIFLPLERLLPMHREQQVFRPGWTLDLKFALFNGIIIRGGVIAILVMAIAARSLLPLSFRSAIAGQTLWLQFLEVLVIADLGFYVAHRMFHRIPVLWRIHQVHHSIESLDWLAGTRVHPVDQVITKGVSLAPVFVLGFSADALVAFGLLYQWQSVLLHSNLRVGFGPLRWLLASPVFHHWHHARDRAARDKNFAGQLPFLDVLFGTSYLPAGKLPERYGIDQRLPEGFAGQLLHPLHQTNGINRRVDAS
jgi:sterol desaturase/sphingolipid hydroxylase (fatty acid hydroxylase superfamily)